MIKSNVQGYKMRYNKNVQELNLEEAIPQPV
jgi:hypothetical protein